MGPNAEGSDRVGPTVHCVQNRSLPIGEDILVGIKWAKFKREIENSFPIGWELTKECDGPVVIFIGQNRVAVGAIAFNVNGGALRESGRGKECKCQ
jgi:hypothetical protein